jgi:hypothetical protein
MDIVENESLFSDQDGDDNIKKNREKQIIYDTLSLNNDQK